MDPALEFLLKTERSLWRGRDQYYEPNNLPTGFAALDKALPGGGWSTGCLTELLPKRKGIGELSLLLPALQALSNNNEWVAMIGPPHIPNAPALANAGIVLERLLIVDTDNDADTLWSTEQLLRSGTFSAVINWVEKSSSKQLRRLQLAAEQSECWAVTYRNARAVDEHSPAALRILLDTAQQYHDETVTTGLQLDLIKVRGGATRQVIIKAHQFDTPQGTEWPVTKAGRSGT